MDENVSIQNKSNLCLLSEKSQHYSLQQAPDRTCMTGDVQWKKERVPVCLESVVVKQTLFEQPS
jgi:hypothetical protein